LLITNQFPNEVILSLSLSGKLPVNPNPSKNISPAQVKQPKKRDSPRKKQPPVKNNPNINWERDVQNAGIKTELVSFSKTSVEQKFSVAVMRGSKVYSLVGRSGSFARLEKEKAAAAKHIFASPKNYTEFCALDIDHVVASCLNDLIGGDRSLAACVMSINPLNRARHYSQQGQSITQRIDQLKNFRFTEFSYSLLEAFNIGMMDYAEARPGYLKYLQRLDKANLLEIVKKAYFDNIPLGVEELQQFPLSFGFADDDVAIKVTFIVNHILLKLKKMPKIIQDLSNYNGIGTKFQLEYLTKSVCEHVFTLENMIKSVLGELNLTITNPYFLNIENELECAVQNTYTQLKYSIKNYELCMNKFDLEKVSSQEFLNLQKLITRELLSPTSNILTPKIRYSLSEFDDNSKLKDYLIGNFGSKKQLENLTLSRNKEFTFVQSIGMTNYTENTQKKDLEEKFQNAGTLSKSTSQEDVNYAASTSQEDVVYAASTLEVEAETIDSEGAVETGAIDSGDLQSEGEIEI